MSLLRKTRGSQLRAREINEAYRMLKKERTRGSTRGGTVQLPSGTVDILPDDRPVPVFMIADLGNDLMTAKRAYKYSGSWAVLPGTSNEITGRPWPGYTADDFEFLADPNTVAGERAALLTPDGFFLACKRELGCPREVPYYHIYPGNMGYGFEFPANYHALIPQYIEIRFPCPMEYNGRTYQLLDAVQEDSQPGTKFTSSASLIGRAGGSRYFTAFRYSSSCKELRFPYYMAVNAAEGPNEARIKTLLWLYLNFEAEIPYGRFILFGTAAGGGIRLYRGIDGPGGSCGQELEIWTDFCTENLPLGGSLSDVEYGSFPMWRWTPNGFTLPLQQGTDTPATCEGILQGPLWQNARLYAACPEQLSFGQSEEVKWPIGQLPYVRDAGVNYHAGCAWWDASWECIRQHCYRREAKQWWEAGASRPCDLIE